MTEVIDDHMDDSAIVDSSQPGPDRLAHAVAQFLPDDYADDATLKAWFTVYAAAFAYRRPSTASSCWRWGRDARTSTSVGGWRNLPEGAGWS